MSKQKLFRIILLCSLVLSAILTISIDHFRGERLPVFVMYTLMFIPAGYVVAWIMQALNWVAFSGSDGDGLRLVPFIGKVLSLPFLPLVWLVRLFRKQAEARKYELGRADRERSEAEARERAFWASPEGQKVRAAQLLAEAEKSKAETLAQIRLAETSGLAGIARSVAQEEEERQRRQLEELKNI